VATGFYRGVVGPAYRCLLNIVTKPPIVDPLSHWGEGCRRRGEGLVSVEERHKQCHYNLQTSIGR
jgi:hypothetical protein